MNTVLIVENVAHSFGDLNLLNDINFDVKLGEIISIRGKSGSGKSTLLSIMSSLLKPSVGDVYFYNEERKSLESIYNYNKKKRAIFRNEKIGFVFQNFNLINELTPLENIMLPIEIFGKRKGELKDRILKIAKDLDIYDKLHSKTSILSGGEKARIALLRSIATEPKIVFLDEPTGALDNVNAKRIENIIIQLSNNIGVSFVYATHDLDFAKCATTQYLIENTNLVKFEK